MFLFGWQPATPLHFWPENGLQIQILSKSGSQIPTSGDAKGGNRKVVKKQFDNSTVQQPKLTLLLHK
jgi:hypothetical protein